MWCSRALVQRSQVMRASSRPRTSMPPCVACTDPSRRRPEHGEVDPAHGIDPAPEQSQRTPWNRFLLAHRGRPRRCRLPYRRSTHAGRCQEVAPTRDVVGDALVKFVYASNRLDSWFCRAFVSRSGRGPKVLAEDAIPPLGNGRPDVLGGDPFSGRFAWPRPLFAPYAIPPISTIALRPRDMTAKIERAPDPIQADRVNGKMSP